MGPLYYPWGRGAPWAALSGPSIDRSETKRYPTEATGNPEGVVRRYVRLDLGPPDDCRLCSARAEAARGPDPASRLRPARRGAVPRACCGQDEENSKRHDRGRSDSPRRRVSGLSPKRSLPGSLPRLNRWSSTVAESSHPPPACRPRDCPRKGAQIPNGRKMRGFPRADVVGRRGLEPLIPLRVTSWSVQSCPVVSEKSSITPA